MNYLVQLGSVDDIRCHLKLNATISYGQLVREIEYEKEHQNRSSVIKMLNTRLKSKFVANMERNRLQAIQFLTKKGLWEWIEARGGMQVGKEELINLLIQFRDEQPEA